jgi:hypothetical protein
MTMPQISSVLAITVPLVIRRAISRSEESWLTIGKAHISRKAMRTNEIFQLRKTTDKQKTRFARVERKVCGL